MKKAGIKRAKIGDRVKFVPLNTMPVSHRHITHKLGQRIKSPGRWRTCTVALTITRMFTRLTVETRVPLPGSVSRESDQGVVLVKPTPTPMPTLFDSPVETAAPLPIESAPGPRWTGLRTLRPPRSGCRPRGGGNASAERGVGAGGDEPPPPCQSKLPPSQY